MYEERGRYVLRVVFVFITIGYVRVGPVRAFEAGLVLVWPRVTGGLAAADFQAGRLLLGCIVLGPNGQLSESLPLQHSNPGHR